MDSNNSNHRAILKEIAFRAMKDRGLAPEFSPAALRETQEIQGPAPFIPGQSRDLRSLKWCSIDNSDSQDLDQLTVAQKKESGEVVIYVAIADVDALAKDQSAIDLQASKNTLTVYTPAWIFSMVPEKLSTDLTSLAFDCDRQSIVFEFTMGLDGALTGSNIYPAYVHNYAKLDYRSTAMWLENQGPVPLEVTRVNGLEENIRIQYAASQKLRKKRFENGALNFSSSKARPVFQGDEVTSLDEEKGNCAKELIEEFMVAANSISARFLESKNFPSIRRVVKTPARWSRIQELAQEAGHVLPAEPDPKALALFLSQAKTRLDTQQFMDLSTSVIKLLGPGEYSLDVPGMESPGHFGLAVKDYAHSTAPNRRYPDLITQRLIKAAAAGSPCPYTHQELTDLAAHCTLMEGTAKKVERQMDKSAAALVLQGKVGQEFDAMVTGASEKGSWVRVLAPPVDGRLVNPKQGMDVGQRLKVRLVSTDVEKGFIDFTPV